MAKVDSISVLPSSLFIGWVPVECVVFGDIPQACRGDLPQCAYEPRHNRIPLVPGRTLRGCGSHFPCAYTLWKCAHSYWRTYKPDVRRSKLPEHTDDTFKIYLQFYRNSPRRVSFNTEFEVHYTRIDATHAISRAASVRIAELEHPDQPDSSEFAVGQGHGFLWRLNNYWRLEEKDGGVYMQVETIGLSRDVPAIFAWFVNPLVRRVSRQTLANLLYATRRGLLSPGTGTSRNCSSTTQTGLTPRSVYPDLLG